MNNTRKKLEEAGCVLEGEFFFALKTKGLVSKKYINIDPIFTNPGTLQNLASKLIQPFRQQLRCLVGPATGGIPLTYAAAMVAIAGLDMSQPCHQISTAFAEKNGDGFIFDRMGFEKSVRGKNVLVVEDISSTGNTTRSVCKLVHKAGGNVIGVSLIWNRGQITAEMLGVPKLHSLITESVETFKIEDNPPGWGTLPLIGDVGHPEYYPDYPGPTKLLL